MTRVVIVNGSARTEKGYTDYILGPFVEGLEDGGASVERFYSKKMKITPCIGCFKCWYETVGKCRFNDDMEIIYQSLKNSDIFIMATPVYIPLPGEFQNLVNRLCPLVEPLLELKKGRTRARFHKDVKLSAIGLVSVGGWWEVGNFDTVIRVAEELASNAQVKYAGSLVRPHAYLLKGHAREKEILSEIREAGRDLAVEGYMPPERLDLISEPLLSSAEMIKMQNDEYLRAAGKLSD